MQGTNNAPRRPQMPVPPPGKVVMGGMKVIAAYRDSFKGKDENVVDYAKVEVEIPSDKPGRRFSVSIFPADLDVIPQIEEAMNRDLPVTLIADLVQTMDRNKKWVSTLRITGLYESGTP